MCWVFAYMMMVRLSVKSIGESDATAAGVGKSQPTDCYNIMGCLDVGVPLCCVVEGVSPADALVGIDAEARFVERLTIDTIHVLITEIKIGTSKKG